MNSEVSYVIGVDYGSDSVRTIIVNAKTGEELAADVFYYPRWQKQRYCNMQANQFRQHPLDYVEGLEATIKNCIAKVDASVAANIKALSVDTTGSTPVATDKHGTPLAMLPGFEENPNAMFVLWKDHTGVGEAAEINAHAEKFETNYLQFVGGIYSSEWFWAKLLHVLRADEAVRNNIYSFVEHCDWIPFLLTGGNDVQQMKRSVCAAGHKILWAKEWDGLPPNEFFATLDPVLDGITARLFKDTYASNEAAGIISKEWAQRLGLPETVVIGVGAYDAHMGAVGGQIEPYHLSKVMGTSTCDMMVAPANEVAGKLVKGICGQVPGSVIPGMIGLEAGQSAFGDAYAWFKRLISWPLQTLLANSNLLDEATKQQLIQETENAIIPALSKAAEKIEVNIHSELAVDWFNGRRTPDANQLLTASVTGLDLGSDAVHLFRAVVESTCFGAKAIVERFQEQGIPVKGLIGLGGVARKSPFVMQMMADVMNMPIRIHRSEQTCALGAAMFAATAAGIYDKVEDAMQAMGQGFDAVYEPDAAKVALYQQRYEQYKKVGAFMEAQVIH
ncbi:ribulokinase [Phnomibacter sp. MR]|uniref:ribulokinase n=1 Tax=Phnomibacter sp. MR TaxID=3042318 RepID=UPI003A808FE5